MLGRQSTESTLEDLIGFSSLAADSKNLWRDFIRNAEQRDPLSINKIEFLPLGTK
jgi:hypothetical protein